MKYFKIFKLINKPIINQNTLSDKSFLVVDRERVVPAFFMSIFSSVISKKKKFRPILKTGQTITYVENDDGNTTRGLTKSYVRDATTQIITDNITGLMWQDDATSALMIWADAINYCENIVTLGGYTDWRLPNSLELVSLVDYGRNSPAIDPVFQNIISYYYWSSTVDVDNISSAWYVHFQDAYQFRDSKTLGFYAMCVRGGE